MPLSLSDRLHRLAGAFRLTGDLRSVTYGEFFDTTIKAPAREVAAGVSYIPYCCQRQLAAGPLPDTVRIRTWLRKTAAIAIACLYRQWFGNPSAPRQLVRCPPMRAPVEQTRGIMRECLERDALLLEQCGLVPPTASLFRFGRSGTYRQTPITDSAIGSAGARLGGLWEATGSRLDRLRFPSERSGSRAES